MRPYGNRLYDMVYRAVYMPRISIYAAQPALMSCYTEVLRYSSLARARLLAWMMVGLTAGVLHALALTASVQAQPKLLGEIDFPNSGAEAAQADFMEGVLFLHNFEYEDAARAFRRAQESDPDFAMAYWGEAMTHNHPIWMQQDREAALEVLNRLAPTPEGRQAKASTQREKDYLVTLETLYGTTGPAEGADKETRDDLYRDAMQRLHDTYPDDHEAATFYGLSILGTAHEGRDFATYMEAASILEQVWAENDKHPGAAHYLIHSYDDPIHAPLGLRQAVVYAEIAPAAAHAQHMTSHIFVALGMWDDVAQANEVARRVQNERQAELDQRPVVCGHYPYWLEYGYLQQGRLDAAAEVLGTCYDRVQDEPSDGELWHYAMMRARYVIDAEDWAAADRWSAPDGVDMARYDDYHFTTGYAALQRGDRATARRSLEAIRAIEQEAAEGEDEGRAAQSAILAQELEALLALDQGQSAEAVRLLRDAAAMEADLPYMFGPPAIVKPTYELLGEVLLQQGQHEAAVDAFEEQLRRTPKRTTALLKYAQAARALGNTTAATDAYRRLAEIWDEASADIPGYTEVMEETGPSTP